MKPSIATPKTLEELGIAIRKIENSDLTNEEALEEETQPCDCPSAYGNPLRYFSHSDNSIYTSDIHRVCETCDEIVDYYPKGFPITLPRILAAINKTSRAGLDSTYFSNDSYVLMFAKKRKSEDYYDTYNVDWKLKQDNSILDATAKHQTEETIKSIIKILL